MFKLVLKALISIINYDFLLISFFKFMCSSISFTYEQFADNFIVALTHPQIAVKACIVNIESKT